MEVGNGDFAPANETDHLRLDQARSHFSMWAMLKSPMLLGNDLTAMSAATLSVVSNREIISLSQDGLGAQARRIKSTPPPGSARVYGTGPAPEDNLVVLAPCVPGAPLQRWRFGVPRLLGRAPVTGNASYTADEGSAPGAFIITKDDDGNEFCLLGGGTPTGRPRSNTMVAVPCAETNRDPEAGVPFPRWQLLPKPGGYSLQVRQKNLLSVSNMFGGSGPLPHTKYVKADPWGDHVWTWPQNDTHGAGSTIRPMRGTQLIDDDNVGHVGAVDSGSMCLTLARGGDLEVWQAPLEGGRVAVSLLNRSPRPAAMAVTWAELGLDPNAVLSVRDIWRGLSHQDVRTQFTDAAVPAHGVTLLVLNRSHSSALKIDDVSAVSATPPMVRWHHFFKK